MAISSLWMTFNLTYSERFLHISSSHGKLRSEPFANFKKNDLGSATLPRHTVCIAMSLGWSHCQHIAATGWEAEQEMKALWLKYTSTARTKWYAKTSISSAFHAAPLFCLWLKTMHWKSWAPRSRDYFITKITELDNQYHLFASANIWEMGCWLVVIGYHQ
jgi:hypothetical protein